MKHFTGVQDVKNLEELIEKAFYYKSNPRADKGLGANKRIGLLFMNPSMRTRISTQVAAMNLGMEVIVMNIDSDGWKLELEDSCIMNGTGVEHIKDAAPVLGAYFDILCIRTFPQLQDRNSDYEEKLLNNLIKYSGLPVVSLESSTLHPLQSLADIITIRETFKEARKPKIVLSWAPHIKSLPHCVSNSFAQWVNAWDKAEFVITHPEGYELDEKYTRNATIEYDQEKALENADFIYVKNWSSYRQYGKLLSSDPNWMLTPGHLQRTNNAKVMHCLPVRRNVELSDAVLESSHSTVTQQAANRVWAAQSVLSEILRNN